MSVVSSNALSSKASNTTACSSKLRLASTILTTTSIMARHFCCDYRRVTLNPIEEADPEAPERVPEGAVVDPKFVAESFDQGCSLRMPCPQKYSSTNASEQT
eukprot:2062-Heterococcus_DN1.PRE.3